MLREYENQTRERPLLEPFLCTSTMTMPFVATQAEVLQGETSTLAGWLAGVQCRLQVSV